MPSPDSSEVRAQRNQPVDRLTQLRKQFHSAIERAAIANPFGVGLDVLFVKEVVSAPDLPLGVKVLTGLAAAAANVVGVDALRTVVSGIRPHGRLREAIRAQETYVHSAPPRLHRRREHPHPHKAARQARRQQH